MLKAVTVPPRTRKMTPAKIALIRRKLKASTRVFAACLNVTPDTARGWEKTGESPQDQPFDCWKSQTRPRISSLAEDRRGNWSWNLTPQDD